MVTGNAHEVLGYLETFMKGYLPPCRVGIKINLSSAPSTHSPKTDACFLDVIISCLLQLGYKVTLIEGAQGYLRENIIAIGLGRYLIDPNFSLIDIDEEKDVIWVNRNGRRYPIPEVLKCMDVRIAVPCASKRNGFLFSCNVKTLVGLLPCSLCRNGTDSVFSRPIIHENLAETVSDLYYIINEISPFHFYMNGGNTISETSLLHDLPAYYCSTDPIELDVYLAGILQTEIPEYLKRLISNRLQKKVRFLYQ